MAGDKIKPANRVQVNDSRVGDIKDVSLQGIGQSEGIVANGTSTLIVHKDDPALNFGTGSFAIAFEGIISPRSTDQYILAKFTGSTGYYVVLSTGNSYFNVKIGDGVNTILVQPKISNYFGKYAKYLILFDRVNGITVIVNGNIISTIVASGDITTVGSITLSNSLYFCSNNVSFSNMQLNGYRLFNYIPSALHQRELYNNGKPSEVPYALRGATNLELFNDANVVFSTGTIRSSVGVYDINTGTYTNGVRQDVGIKQSKVYKITFTVSNYVSGGIWSRAGGTTSDCLGISRTASGTFTDIIIPLNSVDGNIAFSANSFVGTISNISVIQLGCTLDIQGKNIFEQSTIDTSGNRLHGVVTGGEGQLIIKPDFAYLQRSGITGNTTLTNSQPSGYRIRNWSFKNNGATSCTLNVGTTANGTDVVNGLALASGARLDATILKNYFSDTANTTLYLSYASGSGNSIEFIEKFEKVIF